MTDSPEPIVVTSDARAAEAQAAMNAELLEEALLAAAKQLAALRARTDAERLDLERQLERAHAELDERIAQQAEQAHARRSEDASAKMATDVTIAETAKALETIVARSMARNQTLIAADEARAAAEQRALEAKERAAASEEARARAEASGEAVEAALASALDDIEAARRERDEAHRELSTLRAERDEGAQDRGREEEIASLTEAVDALATRNNEAEGKLAELRLGLEQRAEELEQARAASAEIALRAAHDDALERTKRAHDEAIDALAKQHEEHRSALAAAHRERDAWKAKADELTRELDRARDALADLSSRLVRPTPAPPPGQLEAAIERMRTPTPPPSEEHKLARIKTSYSVTDIEPEHTNPGAPRRRNATIPFGELESHDRSRKNRPPR